MGGLMLHVTNETSAALAQSYREAPKERVGRAFDPTALVATNARLSARVAELERQAAKHATELANARHEGWLAGRASIATVPPLERELAGATSSDINLSRSAPELKNEIVPVCHTDTSGGRVSMAFYRGTWRRVLPSLGDGVMLKGDAGCGHVWISAFSIACGAVQFSPAL